MANFHKNSIPFILYSDYNEETDIILEIGSERGEGSTEFFNSYAVSFKIPFYTVDVSDEAKTKLSHLKNTNFIIENGSSWTKQILPTLNKKIKILYLDNYDWNHQPAYADETGLEKKYNEQFNLKWTNLNCVAEHLDQMINCYDYMAEKSVIICDDTPYQPHSGIYSGKSSAVVPFLISRNYRIVYSQNNGVILVRGYDISLF
jgi:hypothetical protein